MELIESVAMKMLFLLFCFLLSMTESHSFIYSVIQYILFL